jgi:hypothetical protein
MGIAGIPESKHVARDMASCRHNQQRCHPSPDFLDIHKATRWGPELLNEPIKSESILFLLMLSSLFITVRLAYVILGNSISLQG